MAKLDDFKEFVKKNPNLLTFIKNDTMSWQKFYELYDLYGSESSVWDEYLNKKKVDNQSNVNNNTTNGSNNKLTFASIMEMARNIDTQKLQDGITSVQKAIGLFSDMMIKDKPDTNNYSPRPIHRKFDD